jgi:hypothetical protein
MSDSKKLTTYLPRIDRKTNITQIIYCIDNFDKLDWNDLICRAKSWLSKECEVGGRCQIDIKSNKIIVAAEVDGEKHFVDRGRCANYGPIGWHTHPKGVYPSYHDLFNSIRSTLKYQTLWELIIYRGADDNPCLLLYRPKDCVLTELAELGSKYSEYKFNQFIAKIAVNIDHKFKQSNNIVNSISTYFEFKWIGFRCEPKRGSSLYRQMKSSNYADNKGLRDAIRRRIINRRRQMKTRTMIRTICSASFVISCIRIIHGIWIS